MTPLRVTAHVSQAISLRGPIALDALLMALVARRDGLPPAEMVRAADGALPTLAIPLALSPCARFYLCSHAVPVWQERELRYKNRRAPLAELTHLTDARTLNLGTGPNKSYRVPYETGFLERGRLDWYCDGDAEGIRALLALCSSLGRQRGVGTGRVDRWEVADVDPWPGFPVVLQGAPLRPVPADWDAPESVLDEGYLMPPYWDNDPRRREFVRRAA